MLTFIISASIAVEASKNRRNLTIKLSNIFAKFVVWTIPSLEINKVTKLAKIEKKKWPQLKEQYLKKYLSWENQISCDS